MVVVIATGEFKPHNVSSQYENEYSSWYLLKINLVHDYWIVSVLKDWMSDK